MRRASSVSPSCIKVFVRIISLITAAPGVFFFFLSSIQPSFPLLSPHGIFRPSHSIVHPGWRNGWGEVQGPSAGHMRDLGNIVTYKTTRVGKRYRAPEVRPLSTSLYIVENPSPAPIHRGPKVHIVPGLGTLAQQSTNYQSVFLPQSRHSTVDKPTSQLSLLM